MAVETTIQGKNVLVFQSGDTLSFEFIDGHSVPESSPTTVATGSIPWFTVAPQTNGGFAVEWDSAINASPTEQNYDSNGNPIGSPFTISIMNNQASFAATSLEQPIQTSSTSWTTQLPNDDTVAVTFLPNGQSGGAPQLEVQQFDEKGNQVGSSNYQTYQGLPGVGDTQIAALPGGGGYVVTVTDNFSVGGEIGFELFDSNNNLIKANQSVASTGGNGHIGGNALAALTDGGFVMAWVAPQTSTNSGQPSPAAVFTQEFHGDGTAASQPQMLGLSGAGTPQITTSVDGSYSITYTNSTGASQAVLFNENSNTTHPGSISQGTVYTPAPSYTAPDGVYDVNLVGTVAQTVSGGLNPHITIASNDTASTLIGGSGQSTLIAGHDANVLTAGGAADFVFPNLPWNAGQITNFTSGRDQINVSQILTSQGYSGTDPFGDHTLTLNSDGHGGSYLVYNPPGAGSNGIWPITITDIDNVAPGSFNIHNDFYTGYNPPQQGTGTLSKVASFDGSDGYFLGGQLAIDAAGNLYGAAGAGNSNPNGGVPGPATVYEITKTASGYNSTPVVLASSSNGDIIPASVISDAAGNLFATASGGANNDGVVLELSNSASGHSAPTVIATFNGTNGANPTGVVADSSDNLFGATSSGGASNDGVIFEVANGSGTPTVLASFSASVGTPSQLFMDASGDLFGTTSAGGANNDGTVFELAKTASGYANTPTIIASFGGGGAGSNPGGPLVADSAGDLFGIANGATFGSSVIFEIAKTASGYTGTPTILANVASAVGPLAIDGAGNLYAPSGSGGSGAYGGGSVFELAHTASGYASTTTFVADLVSGRPAGGLTADASGNLFGTENYSFPMGGQAPGDVYEVSGSGFVPVSSNGGGGTGGGTGGGAGTGPTYTADNSPGEHLTATAPNATFYAGENSVVMTEDGGANLFIYTGLPWNVGEITNFNVNTDKIDVSAMLKAAGYTGTDPFGDGTLTLNPNGHDVTELVYNPPGAGSNGIWPIAVVNIDVPGFALNPGDFITSSSGSGTGGGTSGGTGGSTGGTGGSTGAGTSETLTANDTAGQQLTADKPSATFIAEHNSVIMTGDGGDNIYVFNALPWNAGAITNFNPAADQIDVSQILQGANYTGTDPDHTLSLSSDGHGGTYLTYNPPGAGSNGIWPITVVDVQHVTSSQFQSSDWIFHH